MSQHGTLTSLLALGFAFLAGPSSAAIAGEVEFNRDIRPILRETCFRCHGPDSGSRKADLRLDKRDDAIKSGAIAPGKLDESELIARILSDDPEEMMPPPAVKKPLDAAQKELLKKWVASGAEYQPHWAFIAPTKVEPPHAADPAWDRNPIDRFLFAKMTEKGFKPAPEADRRTLARRASLDITGLPPKIEDVEAFVEDASPDAYEKYLDRLLESPSYGEHRARYWLDAARYGDTHGIHIDNYREIWSYRDWVIKAFNANQAVRPVHHRATGRRPPAQPDARPAGGLGVQPLQHHDQRRRARSTRNIWSFTPGTGPRRSRRCSSALTTGCAVCHDHKFDPISQKEFYELSAFFNNTTQAAMDGNVKDTPPTVFVPEMADRPRWDALVAETAGVKAEFDARKQAARSPNSTSILAASTPDTFASLVPVEGQKLRASLANRDSTGEEDASRRDRAGRRRRLREGPGVLLRLLGQAIETEPRRRPPVARMDEGSDFRGWDLWLEGGKVAAHIIHKWPDDAFKVVSDASLKPTSGTTSWSPTTARARPPGSRFTSTASRGRRRSPPMPSRTRSGPRFLQARPAEPLEQGRGRSLPATCGSTPRPSRPTRSLAWSTRLVRLDYLASKPATSGRAAEVDAAFLWYLTTQDEPSKQLAEKVAKLEKEQAEIKARGTIAHVMNERAEEAMAYILFRGDYDKRRDR